MVAASAIAALSLALIYLLPSTRGDVSPMDEGVVVAYAARVLDGAVPHRDFLTVYGPGNIWIVAAAFALVGESVGVERAVGLAYRLLLVLALFLLSYRIAGLGAALLAALLAIAMLGAEQVWAYATYGALAFGLLGLALTAFATEAHSRWQTAANVVGGALCGAAVLVRFDFVVPVLLAALPLLALMRTRGRLAFAGGLGVMLSVYAVHGAIVGSDRIGRVVRDLMVVSDGRELPIPTLWTFPGVLLSLAVLVTTIMLAVGAALWRRAPDDVVPRLLVGAGLLVLGLLPYGLFRADAHHIRPVALVPVCLLPALALVCGRSSGARAGVPAMASTVVAAITIGAVLVFGDFTLDRARDARAFRDGYQGFGTRAMAERSVVARARELARPGDLLFVGPQDLRRTNYGPTYVYFLLRELEPASYYMEMIPGTANRENSGLADDLRGADWLILTNEWDDWDEPNASRERGSAKPNGVVREEFCVRFQRGTYALYERCARDK